jgi:hypothetical protein
MLAEAVRLPVSSHSPSLRWFGGAIAHPNRYEALDGEPAFCDPASSPPPKGRMQTQ